MYSIEKKNNKHALLMTTIKLGEVQNQEITPVLHILITTLHSIMNTIEMTYASNWKKQQTCTLDDHN